jgi:DNA-binding IclR family transcriptional regulator
MTKRGEVISRAIRLIRWIERRRTPFACADLMEVAECDRRTVYRWIAAAEANGLIERHGITLPEGGGVATLWRAAR